MRAVSRSWRRSHIDGLRHSRDADRLWKGTLTESGTTNHFVSTRHIDSGNTLRHRHTSKAFPLKARPTVDNFAIIISPEIMQRVNFRELRNLHSGIVLPGVLPFFLA